MSSPTHFSPAFDAIDVETAPGRAAVERAMAMCAAEAAGETPGFYLLNDAGGRFVIDRDFGVVSLGDEALLARERGQIHTARIRVVEASGAGYELDLALRLSGRVPQLVTREEIGPAAHAQAAPLQDWAAYANAAAASGKAPLIAENARYGEVLHIELPAASVQPLIASAAALAPASAHASWSIC